MTLEQKRALALAKARRRRAEAQKKDSTNIITQGGSGINEGLASVLGAPVDLMTGAMNLGVKGINSATGSEIPEIEDPFLGSGTYTDLMKATNSISDKEPQTAAQRYARSIGREAGAMAIPGGAAAVKAKSLAGLLGLETASAIGAGVGSQAARDIAPDQPLAEFAGSMVGGLTPLGVSRKLRPPPKAPSLNDLRIQQEGAYQRVEDSGATLKPTSSSALATALRDKIAGEGVPEFLPTSVRALGSKIDALPKGAKVTDIEDLRRRIGNDVAGSGDGQTSRIGVGLKREVDSFMDNLVTDDLAVGSPKTVLPDLKKGRELTTRIMKSEELAGDTGAFTKAYRRAATSGVGGNEVNAVRQNLASILNNPKKRRGYSKPEIDLMEKIVSGTSLSNTLRQAGRLSPTTGALQQMASGGLFAGAMATSNPLLAIPPVLGYAAKGGSQGMARSQVAELGELVRNGKPLAKKTASDTELRALAALMAAHFSGEAQQ